LTREAITLIFEDQRHRCNPFALVFLMMGLRDPFNAGRLTRSGLIGLNGVGRGGGGFAMGQPTSR
jgi:hypothetical protein